MIDIVFYELISRPGFIQRIILFNILNAKLFFNFSSIAFRIILILTIRNLFVPRKKTSLTTLLIFFLFLRCVLYTKAGVISMMLYWQARH